jgi:hypothetical protein
VEIELFQDGGQIKIKMNIDHHNANYMPIDSHLPQADPFSLVPTFNVLGKKSVWKLKVQQYFS